jgi:hypothetical protein
MNIKKATGDIKYEIDMLHFTADYLSNPRLPQVIKNVLIESFAIHARNLYIFFYTDSISRKKDDVVAQDFAINKRKFKIYRTKKILLKFILKRVAKQIAHLTYHRAVYNKKTKPWKHLDIRIKMDKTIDAFINSLPDGQKNWFK